MQGYSEADLRRGLRQNTSRRYKTWLAAALRQAGIAEPRDEVDPDEPPPPDPDDESDGDGHHSASESEPEPEEDTQRNFLGFSPTLPQESDPPEVRTAYALITHPINGFRQSIFFDLVPVLRRVYFNVLAGRERIAAGGNGIILNPQHTQLMLGGGRCQSQKTPLKVVQILMCRLLGVATVVITTGVGGREDLFKKFTTFLGAHL